MNAVQKKYTVTVGIPAYNEEANIAAALDSIIKQEQILFQFEKILVVCDGCKDQTENIAREFARTHPIIDVISDGERLGKAKRLNQIRTINQSDFVINFDADVILEDSLVIDRMIKSFDNDNVALVCANNQPVAGQTFVGKITQAGDLLWYEIRKDFKNGENIYNSSGSATALRKSFAASLKYPEGTVADQQFVFLKTKEQKKEFRFIKDAVVLYRSPANLHDFFIQAGRSLSEKYPLSHHFDQSFQDEYIIPRHYKLRGVARQIIANPIYTTCALFCQVLLRLKPAQDPSMYKSGIWEVARSTKEKVITQLNNAMLRNVYVFFKLIACEFFVWLEDSLKIQKPKAAIICYHSISDDQTIIDVSRRNFIDQLDYLMSIYEIVPLDKIVDYAQGRIDLYKPSAAITFDDGYKDLYDNVVPTFRKFNIPATVFAIADQSNIQRDEVENEKPLLSFEQMKEMIKSGWTIGSHTKTHANLTTLPRYKCEDEILESKRILEKALDCRIDYFAFPKGLYDEASIKICEQSEYRAAFSARPDSVKVNGYRFKLPRISIDRTHTLVEFQTFLTRSGLFSLKFKVLLRKFHQLLIKDLKSLRLIRSSQLASNDK